MAAQNFCLEGIAQSTQLGKNGARVASISGTQVAIRNAADTADGTLRIADATATDEAASLGQVQSLVNGVAWKDPALRCETANISVSAAPATIDGAAVPNGSRIALTGQTTGSQNGLWIYNGSTNPLTRPADWATGSNQSGSAFFVQEGTCADLAYTATADPAVVDTDDPLLVQFASVTPGITTIADAAGATGASVVAVGTGPTAQIRAIAAGDASITTAVNGGDVDISVSAGGVTTTKLADDAVTEPKIAALTAVGVRYVPWDFNDAPSINIGALLPATALVLDTRVCVETALAGAGGSLTVGTATTQDLLMGVTDIDEATVGVYKCDQCILPGAVQLIQFINGTLSAGAGRTAVLFVET